MTERMIFEAALERDDPAERGAYLDQACAGDADLRRRVEELLKAHFAPGTFLEAPAIIDDDAPPVRSHGQKIGASLGGEGMFVAECPTIALARLRLMQGKPAEAEDPARRALAVRLERHPDHWTRFDGMILLGGALAGQKKFAEAEPLLIQGYEGLKERQERIPFLWRTKRPAQAAARIVDLNEAWGKKDQADKWRQQLAGAILPTSPRPRPTNRATGN